MAFAFSGVQLKYAVYVDGFNLYNRCLKDTPYKWLDIRALIHALSFTSGQLVLIRYFTAHLSNRPSDPGISQRQQTYLRALRTLPELTIHLGQFKPREVKGALIDERTRRPGRVVTVQKFEEKGSDVNIASYMLADGFMGVYDSPILISNDSDLSAPIQLIREKIGKPVGLVSPEKYHMTELAKYASYKRKIRSEHLAASQFPPVLVDQHGTFKKPPSWP